MSIPFTITNESISCIWKGNSYQVAKGSPNYLKLREALLNGEWDQVPNFLSIPKSIEKWAKGKFKYENEQFTYDGKPIPANLNGRIREMAAEGKSPESLFRFWEKLQLNPSHRSVTQLWDFLQHQSIPLTPEGDFLAYKAVQRNYLDHHSSTFPNKPGSVHEMPRNEISDDPNHACHQGFHVGALTYAKEFHANNDSRIMICRVNSADVVCVPYDEQSRKMRVCRYEVVGHMGDSLPDLTFEEKIEPPAKKNQQKPEQKKAKGGFAKMHAMDMAELMGQSINNLRQYAGKRLNIVGASKIPGGKTALVYRILEVRKGQED